MKKIFFLLFTFEIILSNDTFIVNLQKKFTDEVVILNIYKKHLKQNFDKHCDSSDINCQIEYIKSIKTLQIAWKNKKLQESLKRHKNRTKITEEYFSTLKAKTLKKLEEETLENDQFISILDLSRQLFLITFYKQESESLELIGVDLISSGDMEREIEINRGDDHYFKTPSGLYSIKSGWRSDGKYKKDNVTQGYGEKGRFIYYLGEHSSIRYNVFDENGVKQYDRAKWRLLKDNLNLAVHAHKSSKEMGKAYSHGCVRMTNEMNYFLDNVSVLHKNLFVNGQWKLKYSKPPRNKKYLKFAGEYLIIFDKI